MLFWHLGVTAAVVYMALGRRRIDYRVVLLGAILPDVIDKPIGRIFFENTFQTSRLYAHTLAFTLLLFVLALVLAGRGRRRWFVLPIATLLHLALDSLWNDPATLFWPLFGTTFPPDPSVNYWLEVLLRPFTHPAEALKEIVGLVCLVYLGVGHGLHRVGIREFLRTGLFPAEPRRLSEPRDGSRSQDPERPSKGAAPEERADRHR